MTEEIKKKQLNQRLMGCNEFSSNFILLFNVAYFTSLISDNLTYIPDFKILIKIDDRRDKKETIESKIDGLQ